MKYHALYLFTFLTLLTMAHRVEAEPPREYFRPEPQPDADGRVIVGRARSQYWKPFMNGADLSDYHHASPEAVEAFKDMKYGLRIHWGIYSFIHGQESWVIPKVYESKPEFLAWYHQLYKGWYPDQFDADAWMKMAADNGFKFFVFTTKHHDGFSLYDTQTRVVQREAFTGPNAGKLEACDLHYSVMETPFKRDITGELVAAARVHGLKVGLYYSNPDWFDGDARVRRTEAGRTNLYQTNLDPVAKARFEKRHGDQIRELLTQYGKVDLLSLDLNMDAVYWQHMQSAARMARALQPDVMIRWRGIGHYGDYQTPENVIPGDEDLGTMPWQVIHTLSTRDIFSYEPDERFLRDGRWIIDKLVDITAKGGNFMVGVGPDIAGNWHPKALEALKFAGDWLEVNGEAIYATRSCERYKVGNDTWFTRSKDGHTIYALRRGIPEGDLAVEALPHKPVQSVSLLGFNSPLSFTATNGVVKITLPDSLRQERDRPERYFLAFKINYEKR